MTVRPAAGPLTDKGDFDSVPTTRPPTIPAMTPAKSGAPDASAMPRHKGSATRKTTIDAGRSLRQLLRMDWVKNGLTKQQLAHKNRARMVLT